jgi:hypothetical protein
VHAVLRVRLGPKVRTTRKGSSRLCIDGQ